MAHEHIMKSMEKSRPFASTDDLIKWGWEYADAMQAEADKRKPKPELPSLQQTFIDGVEQPRYAPSLDDWQPDWSQAPEWAVAWAMDMSGECYWHSGSEQPKVKHHIFESSGDGHTFEAPSFGYKGDWKESLRKRP